MIRSLYTSAMGMILQEKRQANVAQNLANIDTNSFKRQDIISKAFDRVAIMNKDNNFQGNRLNNIGDIHLGVEIDDLYSDFDQGILEETNNPLELAIDGQGFFTVQLPSGNIAYTRDGSFRINNQGQLATKENYLVLARNQNTGALGPILLDSENFQVDRVGNISQNNGQNYTLNIVAFEDNQSLHRLGENLYTSEGAQPIIGGGYLIRQGFLEKSNVNPLDEMVKMIEVTRSFESNQRALLSIDETLKKAVNEVGKL